MSEPPSKRLDPRHLPSTWIDSYQEPTQRGGEEILAEAFADLGRNAPWWPKGFDLVGLPGGRQAVSAALQGITDELRRRVRAEGLIYPSELPLEKYHHLPGLTDSAHAKIARWGFPIEALGLDERALIDTLSDSLRRRLRFLFIPQSPPIPRVCGLRIIRPQSADHNPFHRDGWLPMYHRSINLWLPLLHCTQGSSLRVFPGSHRWPEKLVERSTHGALIGRRRFSVPGMVRLHHQAEPIEPLPQPGEGLFFSSFLIHGGGRNAHRDMTRISAEIRFLAA